MNKRILQRAGFGEEVKAVEQKECPICSIKIDMEAFRDALSVKEFKISGICQKCQDDIFD